MSHISCPLCGKNSSINTFNPKGLDLEIYCHDVQGLGRGKGFKNVNKRIASRDSKPVIDIKNRLLDLILMLYNENTLIENEIVDKLGLSNADQSAFDKKYEKIQNEFNNTKNQLNELNNDLEESSDDIDFYQDSCNSLVTKIADALDEYPDDWEIEIDEEWDDDEEIVTTLEFGVKRLISNYEANNALVEELE